MSIVTKTGDDGKSRFLNRTEDKDGALLEAVGAIDELMAVIGIVRIQLKNNDWNKIWNKLHDDLYQLSGYLTGNEVKILYSIQDDIKKMEDDIERMEKELPAISKFLVPGTELNGWTNWARTVARRAERKIVGLSKHQEVDKEVLKYFNRLSDYLFMLSRYN